MNSNLKANAGSFFAGVLTVNSIAHWATAVAQNEHLTPLAGRHSGPVVNAIWGVMNLSGGLAIARLFRTPGARWGQEKHAYGAGVATFGAWMLCSELMWRTNCA